MNLEHLKFRAMSWVIGGMLELVVIALFVVTCLYMYFAVSGTLSAWWDWGVSFVR